MGNNWSSCECKECCLHLNKIVESNECYKILYYYTLKMVEYEDQLLIDKEKSDLQLLGKNVNEKYFNNIALNEIV